MELDGNADAVEFCPIPSHSQILAAATYNLVEATPDSAAQRLGSVSLFEVSAGGDPDPDLRLVHRHQTSGVFDIKWKPSIHGDDPVLAQAGADGAVTIYTLREKSLEESTRLETSDDDSMCLAVDWNPFSAQDLAVSHSNGSISVITISDGSLELDRSWSAHRFEAWTTSFDAWNRSLLFTGADDSHFCGWDLRSSADFPVFRDAKSHGMGVCCIQSSHLAENIVATGSYDEKLRLWDLRMINKPVLAEKIELGGGVWRIKWHPIGKGILAAACMHNGFAIVDVDRGQSSGAGIIQVYEEHKSLAYGVDWSKNRESPEVIATCSFYDRSLRIWSADLTPRAREP